MKKITVNNWQGYGNYMVYADVVNYYNLDITLCTYRHTLTASGNEGDLHLFGEALKKKQIPFNIES